jgi:hypothetical protein
LFVRPTGHLPCLSRSSNHASAFWTFSH